MIKVKITINFTKVLALLILIASVFVAWFLNDASVFVATVPSLAIILGVRDYSDKNKPVG